MRVITFDTETTGLPETRDRIVTTENLNKWPYILQLSWIVLDTDQDKITGLGDYIISVNEDVVISEGSIELHKITKEISTEKGIDVQLALIEFFNHVKDADIIVGHNISFDLNMVRAEMMRHGVEIMKYTNLLETKKKFCTMKESTAFCCLPSKYGNSYNKLKPPKLIELNQKLFDETPTGLHNSMNDVIVTLRCFIKLRYDKDIGSILQSQIVAH